MIGLGQAVLVIGAGLLLAKLFFAVIEILAKRSFQKAIKNRVTSDANPIEDPKYGTLIVQMAGFKIVDSHGSAAELLWKEIEEIHAFKRDLITTDLICLAFRKSDQEGFYEISEEMAGYSHLLDAMENNLSGFNLNWMLDVGHPAFATNRRVIWKRTAVAAV